MKKLILICSAIFTNYVLFGQVSIAVTPPTGCFGSTYQLNANLTGPLGTESYTFDTIPYAPEVYAGTNVYLSDDAVTGPLPIGFTFCFLGQNYTQFYIGSNGWISFSGGQSTAYTSATIPNTSAAVPKNAIMGPWQDWHPGIGGQIMYQTIGVAPNRKLVVSWQAVPMFQCTTTLGTFQIVLNETTSIIENHLTNKPNCLSWAGGTATQGVHNISGTLAFVAPGRNSSQWVTTNESTRFVPSGVVWLQGGNIIGYGDSIQVAPTDTTVYTCQVSLCDGTVYSDQVTLYAPTTAVVTSTPPTCSYSTNGSLTVKVDGVINQTDYTYQWNDPNLQATAVATNLHGGTYQVVMTGPGSCADTLTGIVVPPTPVIGFISPHPACDTTASGSVAVSGSGGAGNYQYSFNGGTSFSVNNGKTGLLPGSYTVIIRDQNGCDTTMTFVIQSVASPQIGSISTINPSCLSSDGEIDITMIGATAGLMYSVDGGTTFQSTPSFPNLGVGSYLVVVQNPQGCFVDTLVVLINPNSPVFDAVNITNPSCGMTDGTITINLSGGTTPYSYSINNGVTYQPSNIFTGLAGGTYQISVKDASGCVSTKTIYIVPGTKPTIMLVQAVQPPCKGDSGCISINAFGGIAPLTYSFDNGITFSADSSKCGLLPGMYNLVVKGANGCTVSYQKAIVAQDSVIANFTLNPTTGQSPLNVDFTNTSINASNYTWSFGDGDSSLLTDPSHVFDPKGDYTVILTATHGNCVDTMSVVIHVESDSYIFVPNFFSPNNDGQNDFFQLVSYQGISSLTCIITNQWGNVMAQYNTPDFAWDGNNQAGTPASDGVYFYHIVAQGLDGQQYNLQGFLHLQGH